MKPGRLRQENRKDGWRASQEPARPYIPLTSSVAQNCKTFTWEENPQDALSIKATQRIGSLGSFYNIQLSATQVTGVMVQWGLMLDLFVIHMLVGFIVKQNARVSVAMEASTQNATKALGAKEGAPGKLECEALRVVVTSGSWRCQKYEISAGVKHRK